MIILAFYRKNKRMYNVKDFVPSSMQRLIKIDTFNVVANPLRGYSSRFFDVNWFGDVESIV